MKFEVGDRVCWNGFVNGIIRKIITCSTTGLPYHKIEWGDKSFGYYYSDYLTLIEKSLCQFEVVEARII